MNKEEFAERYARKCADTKYGYNKVHKAFSAGFDACMNNIWKDAQSDDLPPYEREVVVLLDKRNGVELAPYMRVAIAHRPYPKGFKYKSLVTGKEEAFTAETFGKGGWNQCGVKYWLDAEIPNNDE